MWYFDAANARDVALKKRPALTRRAVAQLVARKAGGLEVAGSSPATPTKKNPDSVGILF